MKRAKHVNFQNSAAARRMAANYRKQFGIGLDGQPRRYGPKKKNTTPVDAIAEVIGKDL